MILPDGNLASSPGSLPVLGPGDEPCRFRFKKEGRSVLWEVSRYCNLECLHCCTSSSPSADTTTDVSTRRALEIIREFPLADVRTVLYSGGEPFLRSGFMDFLKATVEVGATVLVASNGMAITARLAEELAKLGVQGVDISLDGHSAETHNAVRVKRTAFTNAIRGIRRCIEGGVPVRVSGMLTPVNVDHIYDFVSLLVSLGVTRAVLQTVVPDAGNARRHPELVLDRHDYEKALGNLHLARLDFGKLIEVDERITPDSQTQVGCPAGSSMLHITPEGDVSGCSWLYKLNPSRFRLGNIKTDSLMKCAEQNPSLMTPLLARTEWCPIPHIC